MATVLVVDDDGALLQFVTMLLEQNGHAVLGALNGVEALMLYSSYRSRIDLVLTDVVMPGMSGVELAQRLRSLNPGLPILLMSGFVPEEIAVPHGFRLIQKPFKAALLIETIGQALTTG
jgi:CheY-like chemotaxis protein